MKTKIPIFLLVLCACNDLTPKVNQDIVSQLPEQISGSPEFKTVLSWAKTLFKPGAVEAMVSQSQGQGKILIKRKVELSQKDAAEFYGFSDFKTLRHVTTQLQVSTETLIMGACYVTYQVLATREVAACNAIYYTCLNPTADVSALTNDESFIFEEYGWNSVPSYVQWNEQCMCWQST